MLKNKKVRIGVVVSNKMQKTVVVEVARRAFDLTFKKIVKKNSKFKAHDEKNECGLGDIVEIIETRPISKDKCWRVAKIITKGTNLSA